MIADICKKGIQFRRQIEEEEQRALTSHKIAPRHMRWIKYEH